MGDLIEITPQHRLERNKRILSIAWEHGRIANGMAVGERMRAGEFTAVEIESLIATAADIESEPFTGPDGRLATRYVVSGNHHTEGQEVGCVIEMYGRAGIVTEVTWLP